jgi:hypothetical protein
MFKPSVALVARALLFMLYTGVAVFGLVRGVPALVIFASIAAAFQAFYLVVLRRRGASGDRTIE